MPGHLFYVVDESKLSNPWQTSQEATFLYGLFLP